MIFFCNETHVNHEPSTYLHYFAPVQCSSRGISLEKIFVTDNWTAVYIFRKEKYTFHIHFLATLFRFSSFLKTPHSVNF